jgi:hypothetical protein
MREIPDAFVAEPKLTTREVMTSVPEDVWKVKASEEVAEKPGPRVTLDGSEPVPKMVTMPGVTDVGVVATPVE